MEAGHAQALIVCPLVKDVILVALKTRKRRHEKECGWYLEAREGKQSCPLALVKGKQLCQHLNCSSLSPILGFRPEVMNK